jgi:hypothetical protein
MQTNFKKHQIIRLQHVANKDFTAKKRLRGSHRRGIIPLIILVTTYISASYGQTTRPEPSRQWLSKGEITIINSLKINSSEIPPWLIAQMLHLSKDLEREVKGGRLTLPITKLNELLANPEKYQGRVLALKAIYVKSSDVKEPLQLSPDERCWSVLLLDVKYCHALQLFTSESPEKFRKNQLLSVIGVFLTTRVDTPETGDASQAIIVPVFVGTLHPMVEGGKSTGYNNFSQFMVIIIFLVFLYIGVRIYVGRKMKEKPFKGLRR